MIFNRTIKRTACWLVRFTIFVFSFVVSSLVSFYLFINSLGIIGNLYELKHPIPKGQDDLGSGLFMLAATVFMLIIVLIFCFCLNFFLTKSLLSLIRKR